MIFPRQSSEDLPLGWVEENGYIVYFWDSTTGIIIKFSLFIGLCLAILIYLIGGRIHAKRRLSRGLMPMAYHRILVSRHELAADPCYSYPPPANTHWDGFAYPMGPMPPPATYYPGEHPPHAPPPLPRYFPPDDAVKPDDPDRDAKERSSVDEREYQPSPGRSAG